MSPSATSCHRFVPADGLVILSNYARCRRAPMPSRESEVLVLRTYPYREADLIVNFVTRDQGKLRGIARGARRPKSRWGSGLERLSHVRLFYYRRENQELAKLDRCELNGPPIFLKADYATSVALDFLAEVSDQLLPEHEPNEAFFRLLLLVRAELWAGLRGELDPQPTALPAVAGLAAGQSGVSQRPDRGLASNPPDVPGWLWRAVTYFALWSVRLGGWLPPLNICLQSGAEFGPEEPAFFERSQPGLFSADFRPRDSWAMAPTSRALAGEMLRQPLPSLRGRSWNRGTAEDLRRFLIQRLEEQFERRLKTASVLEQLQTVLSRRRENNSSPGVTHPGLFV